MTFLPNGLISQWKIFFHPTHEAASSAPPIPLNKLQWVNSRMVTYFELLYTAQIADT